MRLNSGKDLSVLVSTSTVYDLNALMQVFCLSCGPDKMFVSTPHRKMSELFVEQ
jgi:hypothetical protein